MISRLMLPNTNILALPRPGWITDYFKARFRSLDIQLDTVDEVLSHYGLEIASTPKNLPNTRRNHNLIVRTTKGPKILKLYRKDWQDSTIAFEHSILSKLAQLEFPAPRLLQTDDGRTWLNLDSKNYCLFEFINGNNLSSRFLVRSQRVRMMATSGRMLARLHKQLLGFLPDGQHHIGFPNYVDERHRDFEWHVNKVEQLSIQSKAFMDEDDRHHANRLIAHADQLLDEMGQLDDHLRLATLPRVIIHGDYGLHNLIYQNLDMAVPVDYELSRIEWRLVDLISVVSKFRYKDGSYDFESITRFMGAYQNENPISEEEWLNFALVWKFYKLIKAVQYWNSYFETNGPVRKLISSLDEIGQASWALENPERLDEFKKGGR
jgi:Ser/Thr protein kinase RdoA (MazF antagonist)